MYWIILGDILSVWPLLVIFTRCVMALGCSACSNLSTPSTSSGRYQTCLVLHQLHRLSNERFCRFFKEFADQRPLDEIVDFCHSYMNFCTHDSCKSRSIHFWVNSVYNFWGYIILGHLVIHRLSKKNIPVRKKKFR